MTAAAAPDVVGEMGEIIGRLRDMPRPWLESIPDIINNVQRESGRLKVLVGMIEIIEPVAAKKGTPKLARVVTRPRSPQRPAGQLEMAL